MPIYPITPLLSTAWADQIDDPDDYRSYDSVYADICSLAARFIAITKRAAANPIGYGRAAPARMGCWIGAPTSVVIETSPDAPLLSFPLPPSGARAACPGWMRDTDDTVGRRAFYTLSVVNGISSVHGIAGSVLGYIAKLPVSQYSTEYHFFVALDEATNAIVAAALAADGGR